MKRRISLTALFLLVIVISAYGLVRSAPARQVPVTWRNAVETSESSMEKICKAKAILGLAPDAPKGLLWRTYMSRLYGVPLNASLDKMIMGQAHRDWRYNKLFDGLPEWCPDALVCIKNNFEWNVMLEMVGRHVYSISPFASEQEFRRVASEKYREFEAQAGRDAGDDAFEKWYAKQIIKSFGLPKETSAEEAGLIYARYTHPFGWVSPADRRKIERSRQREEALSVLRWPAATSDDQLLPAMAFVTNAVGLESPEQPLKWKLFY